MPARLAMSVTDTEAKPRSTNSRVPAASTSSRREGRWAGRRVIVCSLSTGFLPEVGRLVYEWYAACPDKARLFFLAAPGSTPEIAQTWAEFVEEHVRDLSRYVNGPGAPARKASAVSDLAARTAIGTANAAA